MSSRGIALDSAAIMSTVLEGIFYGFSLLMFGGTLWSLGYRRATSDINRPIAGIATLLLILSTIHMVVDIIRIEEGLVLYRDTFPGGPPAFFADVAQETFVFKNAVYSLQTLLGDGVVIYRCYVVWQSVLIIIVPMMLWCGVAASAVGSVYSVSQATTNSGDIFFKETGQWITAFYASTLATNLLSSGLLAYRIWMIDRRISGMRSSRSKTMPVLRVLMDAAILYSVALFTALMCFVSSNNGQYVVLDMITPIISIAFYMVLIRVAVAKTSHSQPSGSAYSTTLRSGTIPTPQSSQQYPLQPVQVHISQLTESERSTHSEYNKGDDFNV
ncbi:hypothetical protein HYDPIDRAFT_176509 [Hydnomerulius pinastri MD-312]|uniref:Uncharacterized protein n=1 Tax=Hydnomerulius pinastri MD-312 TaxID=994086 RepID=A0A0C9WCR0_9AGAM|nr:hypothetical protein HYDPIDRAFT_176509 [Hydnomerulius pinastri MD-312]